MRNIEYRLRKLIYQSDLYDNGQELAWSVNVESNLVLALGMDSLDAIELVMAVEDEFDVFIEDDVAETLDTIQATVDYLEKLGIPNHEMEGYPDAQDPVIYLPRSTPEEPERYVVVYANALTVSGLDANVYTDRTEATTFCQTLKDRSIHADVYRLVKV